MRPFFSIIIPVYNVAPYLHECLDSIIAQTFTDWEVICVDDGSTDGSGAILDEYVARDSRFRIIHQPNGGVSVARNVGLEIAKGEWVWFVDADDSIRGGSLEFLNNVITRSDGVDVVNICISNTPFNTEAVNFCAVGISRRIERCSDTFWRYRCGVSHSIMRRDKIKELRFVPKMAMGEDTLFHLLAYYRFKTEININEALYFYRDREGSAVKSMVTLRMMRDWISLQMRIIRLLKDNNELTNYSMQPFLKWNSSYVFYTCNVSLFRLTISDMRGCYRDWLHLVDMAGQCYRHTFWKYLLLSVLSVLNSPLFYKIAIRSIHKIRGL